MAKRKLTKEMFLARLKASIIVFMAWELAEPIYKSYYGYLSPTVISLLSILAVVANFLQKKLVTFKIKSLLITLITIDLIYSLITLLEIFTIVDRETLYKFLLITDLTTIALWGVVVISLRTKWESYYLGTFKPVFQTKIRTSVNLVFIKANLIGLTLGGILGYLNPSVELVTLIKVIALLTGDIILIKLARKIDF